MRARPLLALTVVLLAVPALAWADDGGPLATTSAATGVTDETAVLNGTVDPDGAQITDCHFHISPPPKLGQDIPCVQQVGDGDGPVAVTAPMIDLAAAVTYTYSLVVASTDGVASGTPVTFRTPAIAPNPPEIGPSDVTWGSPPKVDAKGRLHVSLHNHMAIALQLVSIVARPAKAAAHKAKATAKIPPPVAQTLAPSLKAQHTTSFTTRLTRAAMTKLRKAKHLRVTITATLVAPDGFLATLTRTVTLRAPRRHA